MNTQSFSVRRPAVPSGLSIRPPSPGQLPLLPPKIVTPTIPNQTRPHATSPTHSTRSNSTHGRRASIETTRSGDGPPVPSKGEKDKRLPLPPWVSPSKRGEKGSYAGAYDNKLVSVYVNRALPRSLSERCLLQSRIYRLYHHYRPRQPETRPQSRVRSFRIQDHTT